MRLLITSILFILSYSFCLAQNQESIKNFELGAIAGFGLSNVVGTDASNDNGLRLGVHLGGYAQFPIQDKFGFRPELHILSIKGTSSGGYRSYYFDMPMLGTYELDDKFKVMAGIQPSILIHARDNNRGGITNFIRTIDLGLVFGGLYKIDELWGIGARITRGILKVGASGDERTYNFNFQFSVTYRIM